MERNFAGNNAETANFSCKTLYFSFLPPADILYSL